MKAISPDFILNKHCWINRANKEKSKFPDNIKKNIDESLEINFKEHCQYIGPKPYNLLANIQGISNKIEHEDEDGVIFIVGPPGSGKTSTALFCSKFKDKTLRNARIIFDIKELKLFFKEASTELKTEKQARLNGKLYKSALKNKALVLDEGVFMLFSGDAMTKEGKLLQKLFSIIRALNLMVFVNVTNFKKINKGIKEDRIILLIKMERRGVINVYSKKNIRKIKIMPDGIKWPHANFNENIPYINPNCKFWLEYENKKADFLFSATEGDK